MKQYKDALVSILRDGVWERNERTGIDIIKSPYPIVTRFHMKDGFPALTGRRAPFKSAIGELCGFVKGVTSAADFRNLGCKFWDQNANENAQWLANPFRRQEDQLGDVYGAQWRRWPAFKALTRAYTSMEIMNKLRDEGWQPYGGKIYDPINGHEQYIFFKEIDQLGDCIRTLITNPSDRRILFHAWNPAKLNEIALPACHLLYQFVPTVSTRELAMSLTIRSNDMPLGYPSNVMEAAAMLHYVAHITGFTPTWLTIMSNDAHIYRNQTAMVNEYLQRPEFALPQLELIDVPDFSELTGEVHDAFTSCEGDPSLTRSKTSHLAAVAEAAVRQLDKIDPTQFALVNYQHGEPISAPMAV